MSRSKQPNAYIPMLGQTFLFRGVTDERIAALLNREGVSVVRFEKGETVFSRESQTRMLGVVLHGVCAVMKESENARIPMSVLKQGELFGAASLFRGNDPYVAHVYAKESVWALLISEDALKAMMRDEFDVAENYMRYLTARIRFLSGRIDTFLPQSVEERVLHHMRQYAKDGAYAPEKGMQSLADALRISRATLYRAVGKLMEEGVLTKDGRTYRITDVPSSL